MRDQPARLFLCARCRVQVLVCSHCDRGQRYCAGGCAGTTRQALQREAGRRYQQGRAGRFKHALRTRFWRERQAALTQIVTHQGSQNAPPDDVLPAIATTPSSMPATAQTTPAQPCTTTLTVAISTPAAIAALVSPTLWRCHWCCMPCAAHVRLGLLRHRPSHGHSP